MGKIRIAVEGCAHGELDKIYSSIVDYEKRSNNKIDLLLICGDFQSIRCPADLDTLACPDKYKRMGDFRKYYTGAAKAYVPTIFIGGNHEASGYLWELYHGGWVAPDIYFLGHANSIIVNGIRICGISGIYAGYDYDLGYFEKQPFNQTNCRSVYHMRSLNVFKFKLITDCVDIMLSHDWPSNIWNFGNKNALLSSKPFFEQDMISGKLGNPALKEILDDIMPDYWFAAHLHTKFAAVYPHENSRKTKFLSLDKCLPKRDFLQIIQIDTPIDDTELNKKLKLEYDPKWIAILRCCSDLFSQEKSKLELPNISVFKEKVALELNALLFENHDFSIPENFQPTASPREEINKIYSNSQTEDFCKKFKLFNHINIGSVVNS